MTRMQKALGGLVLPLMALSLNGCGYGGSTAPAEFTPAPAAQEEAGEDFSQTGFVLAERLQLEVVAPGEANDRERFELPAGAEIAILETREDPAAGQLVRVGIDSEEGSGLPTDVWVRSSDLPPAALVPYAPADEDESADAALKKMTYCYRYVKQYLLKTGKVKVYLPGSSAYQAASILPRHGFRRTGHSPANARNGEVCVYSGGPAGHGHIEVKRNGKWWYGYGFNARPIQNRRFIACFDK